MREARTFLPQGLPGTTARGKRRRRIRRVRPARRRALISFVALAALGAAPASAGAAADTAVLANVGAQTLAALDGTVVQITGTGSNAVLMQRNPSGPVMPVAGAPPARYRSIDLGHDHAGRLVLTYIRCSDSTNCRAYADDLAGHRTAFTQLTPTRCRLTTAPARWDSRVAYGLTCSKLRGPRGVFDPVRSGLFVRTGNGAPKRLKIPSNALNHVNRVDLRGTIVGAVSPGRRSYAFTQTINGTHLRSMRITDQDELEAYRIIGASLGAGGRLWTLVTVESFDAESVHQVISRLGTTICTERGTLRISPDADPQPLTVPASALAADDHTLRLATAAGVVVHQFRPTFCR